MWLFNNPPFASYELREHLKFQRIVLGVQAGALALGAALYWAMH